MLRSDTSQPSPSVFCARRASKLVASLFGKLASHPEALEASMLRHLRAMEAIEARLAERDVSPAELVSLVALAHETLHEIHHLHLRAEMRRIYVNDRGTRFGLFTCNDEGEKGRMDCDGLRYDVGGV